MLTWWFLIKMPGSSYSDLYQDCDLYSRASFIDFRMKICACYNWGQLALERKYGSGKN